MFFFGFFSTHTPYIILLVVYVFYLLSSFSEQREATSENQNANSLFASDWRASVAKNSTNALSFQKKQTETQQKARQFSKMPLKCPFLLDLSLPLALWAKTFENKEHTFLLLFLRPPPCRA